ncbi:MAG: acyl carrier protein [Oscillospiraceae bacterium]|nr:acyl carrier protein [Oscillospiraceae bacterium]MCR5165731.1 acyl carrier protein [Oscillospiraceae bacterium]
METKRQELLERVKCFLVEHAEGEFEDFGEKSQLIADLGFNSLDLMEIVNDAEDEFSILIDDSDIDKIITVGDFIDLVEKKTKGE